jgi:hypothetical protein
MQNAWLVSYCSLLTSKQKATEEVEGADRAGSQVGSKRKRASCNARSAQKSRRLIFSMALYKYGQTLRNQADILKVLSHKIMFLSLRRKRSRRPG